MKKWVVFEAGSRAGLSALLYFKDYKRKTGTNDELFLVDSDEYCVNSLNSIAGVKAYGYDDFYPLSMSCTVFPADEMTRQKNIDVEKYHMQRVWYNDVHNHYYNKVAVCNTLRSAGISVPETFDLSDVFVKPNTLSAGSRGLMPMQNVCVQQHLDIQNEYVVDATVSVEGKILGIVAREVKLRCGYDKLIRLLPHDHPAEQFAASIIQASDMFRGVCHLQVCRTSGEDFYFIEWSKRISGTSLVNLLAGYNPFMLLDGHRLPRKEYDSNWHTYEDLLIRVNDLIHE